MQNKPCQHHLFTLCMHYNSILGVTCEHGSSAHSCWISLFRRRLRAGRWGLRQLGYAPQTIACGKSCGLLLFLPSAVLCFYLASCPVCIKLWMITLLLIECVICLWYHFCDCVHWNPGLVYEHREFGILRSRVRQKWYQSHIDCRSWP